MKMKSTPTYGLYLEDDDTTKFKDWREKMNGVSDSNMTKIENALNDKAQHSEDVHGVLLAAAWSGTDAPYTQELAVAGLSSTQNGNISIGQTATAAQRKAARDAILSVTGQADNKLIITADGEKPTVDIPVVTVLLG